jgi:hypothetical protein
MNKLIAVLACLCLLGCRQDPEVKPGLVFGESAGLLVTRYDTIIAGDYLTVVYLDLDVDRDGSADFRLTSEKWGSLGLGHYPKTQVLSLRPDCRIQSLLLADSVFFYGDTSVYTMPDSTVVVKAYRSYNCAKYAVYDSMIRVGLPKNRIAVRHKGDLLQSFGTYVADTLLLNEGNLVEVLPARRSNDTIYETTVSSDYDCYHFPNDEVAYIGVTLSANGHERAGWIKLNITGNLRILLLETAILQ